MEFKLPSYADIIATHDVVLEISGGKSGVSRSQEIHSATERPKTYSQYNEIDIHTICALLLDSLARNHSFKDGNKRTGLLTMLVTYKINGIPMNLRSFQDDEFEKLVLWVVNDKPSINELRSSLKLMTKKHSI